LSNDVANDKAAIGFIGLPYVLSARPVPVADVGAMPLLPNRLTVSTEHYPLARRLFLYTGAAGGNTLAPRFADFALSPEGQAIAEQTGFVALTVKPEATSLPHTAPDKFRRLVGRATPGDPGANMTVSKKRADAVGAGLAQRGLRVGRVAAFGADLPVADNATDGGREKNRRVEVYKVL
jgi:phosphate transport system substrate-binding protein